MNPLSNMSYLLLIRALNVPPQGAYAFLREQFCIKFERFFWYRITSVKGVSVLFDFIVQVYDNFPSLFQVWVTARKSNESII